MPLSGNGSGRGQGGRLFLMVLAGWLLPGSGFFLLGRNHRKMGWLYFGVVHLTFILGLLLKGGVVWPTWGLRDVGFSIVNNLNFVFQMGTGWMAFLSLVAYALKWPFLAIQEPHAYSELGSFYCLVAGALNYFIIWQAVERREKIGFEMLTNR